MQKQIAAIRKNAREELQVSLTEFKGHDLIDVRVYADTGEKLVATRKGVAASVECLPAIVEALQRAVAEARAAGLLSDTESAA